MIVLDGGWQFLPGMQLDKIGLIAPPAGESNVVTKT
jgi:hypothetical protein